MTNCPLCNAACPEPFFADGDRVYHHCPECDLRSLAPAGRISSDEEKQRYLLHENDVDDPRYRDFVRPLHDEIIRCVPAGAQGLDYGAGIGPVLATMLTEAGYTMLLYDPFFHPDRACLDRKYEFVILCEVAEHFHEPRAEFQRLRNLLVEGGVIGLSTLLWDPTFDFARWHYRNDVTHTTFYSPATLFWIAEHFRFTNVRITSSRVVILTA